MLSVLSLFSLAVLIFSFFFAGLFSGLSVVTHFSDYRKKQKRINSGEHPEAINFIRHAGTKREA